jgi:hypothetical protein
MRRLFGDIVAVCVVGKFPVACERLAEDWIKWFLHSTIHMLALSTIQIESLLVVSFSRRFDVPSTQVEPHHRHKSLHRIVDFRHREQRLRVCHEAISRLAIYLSVLNTGTHFVILSSILLGSRMKVGSTTRLRSAPGRSWLMICDKTKHSLHQSPLLLLGRNISSPFPCSGSTTVVSSSGPSDFDSSYEDLLPIKLH